MRVIAIDFDGTASDHPEKVNKLFDDQKNLIIIYTARPEYLRRETEEQLKELGINYHLLKMDKLRADVYIDDKNAGGLIWPKYQVKDYKKETTKISSISWDAAELATDIKKGKISQPRKKKAMRVNHAKIK